MRLAHRRRRVASFRDAAEGCWLAATKGKAGERYLLANEGYSGIEEVVQIAQRLYPERKMKMPRKPPRLLVYLIASLMEAGSKLSGKEPQLQRNYLSAFSVREQCDISKARRELGFDPQPPHRAVAATLRYLAEGHANDARVVKQVA